MKKPGIHLWVYNHPMAGITDQVSFFIMAFQQHGYRVTLGRRPHQSSLNVIIENFSPQSRDVLWEFCQSSKKRVAIIMTEHLDFEHGQIFFHGTPLGSENDYMHPATMLSRVKHLLESLPYIRGIFVLGDLPELRNISTMLPGLEVRAIPFPRFDDVAFTSVDIASEPINDFVFTGVKTGYRGKILKLLTTPCFSVAYPNAFVSRRRRNALNRSSKLILNIPQREGWQWLSLMRIVAGLQVGRATVSVGTSDTSQIASCCTQVDVHKKDWIGELRQCVANWKSLYFRDIESYSLMAKAFEEEHPFPHDVLEYWSITDRVCG